MRSTKYSRFCRRLFASLFKHFNFSETSKNRLLEKANISMIYQEYFSMVLMNIIIGFIFSFMTTLFFYLIIPNDITALLILVGTSLVPVLIGLVYIQLPAYKIKGTRKKYRPLFTLCHQFH